jgi:hypothetical protein
VIDVGNGSFVPFEIRWADERTLVLSYSLVKVGGVTATSAIASIDLRRNQTRTVNIGAVAMHNYPSGAALGAGAKSVVYSPLGGGLVHLSLRGKGSFYVVRSGSFSSPFVFSSTSGDFLVALRNPSIVSTRDFKAELLIEKLVK